MASVSRFLFAGLPLALAACVDLEPNTKPQSVERGVQTENGNPQCGFGARTYRPTPNGEAPYDATIPPTYDAPSQAPSYCNKELSN